MDALETLYRLPTKEGHALYGPSYKVSTNRFVGRRYRRNLELMRVHVVPCRTFGRSSWLLDLHTMHYVFGGAKLDGGICFDYITRFVFSCTPSNRRSLPE